MNLWVVLLFVCLVPALTVIAVLLWIGTNAILHGRGITREAAITIASVRRALRSIYDDTAHETLPDDFRELLGKLSSHGPGKTDVSTGTIVFNEPIVAIGLLTERQVRMLGPTLSRVWPVAEAPCFPELSEAIGEAVRRIGAQGTATPPSKH